MLAALKFVKGAVASKGFAPELTHFKIENGFIKGFNGALALCSPIDLDINATPKGLPFVKAVTACKATTAMHMTPTGRLAIKSGSFKAFIECADDDSYPDILPEGEFVELNGSFLGVLKILAPFMAEDASRSWARGIILKGQSAFVTNNIVIIEKWMAQPFPVNINIPASAVKELVRIKEEPSRIQICERSVTFHYDDGRWLRTSLTTETPPDFLPVLNRECDPKPFPDGFFQGIVDISTFADDVGRIIMQDGCICTDPNDGLGASVSFEGLPEQAIFNWKQLLKLEGVADTIDFNMYPSPSIFYGDGIRGAIIGIKSL